MKHLLTLTGLGLLLFCFFGCSSEDLTPLENPTTLDATDWYSAAPLAAEVVLENMYEPEVRSLADKTPVHIVTVIEGTSRVTIDARYRGIRDLGLGFPVYECELTDAAAEAMGGIASGMSGSPVGPAGRVMGALAYGDNFSGSPMRFWVTPIDAMEQAKARQTAGESLDAFHAAAAPSHGSMYVPVKTPLMLTGIQPHHLSRLASHLKGPQYEYLHLLSAFGGAPQVPVVGEPTSLMAGSMIGAAAVTGDVVNAIGYGTVTQVYDDGTFLAFGHPMTGNGQTALSVYQAVTYGIVPSLEASYKSVIAYGEAMGTITKDLTPAIVGITGSVPEMIPVKLVYQAGTDAPIEKNHEVAYGQESFISIVGAFTMDAIRQESSPSTIDATLSLSFKEADTVYTDNFRIATEDVLFETLFALEERISLFTSRANNAAGKATLKNVEISIKDTPQFRTAVIHDIVAPDILSPGTTVSLSIMLLPHWSAANQTRHIEKVVEIDIPKDFPIGEAILDLTASGSADPFFDDYYFFDDEAPEAAPAPETLDELIQQLQEDQTDDPGMITITLQPAPFDWDAYFEIVDNWNWDAGSPPDPPEDDDTPPTIEKEIVMDGFIVSGTKQITVPVDTPTPEPDNEAPKEEPPPAPAD